MKNFCGKILNSEEFRSEGNVIRIEYLPYQAWYNLQINLKDNFNCRYDHKIYQTKDSNKIRKLIVNCADNDKKVWDCIEKTIHAFYTNKILVSLVNHIAKNLAPHQFHSQKDFNQEFDQTVFTYTTSTFDASFFNKEGTCSIEISPKYANGTMDDSVRETLTNFFSNLDQELVKID